MNILLTGAAGQLGQELLPLLDPLGTVTTVDRNIASVVSPQCLDLDLSDLNRVEILLNRLRPDLVVNAAAYTAVDQAENDSEPAFRMNADLPGCIARWVERNGRLLFHYSTDYVFDGQADQPYRETDETCPINVYGESKLAGEWAVTASKCRFIVLRTSWVYSAHGSNFVLSMLRLARERSELRIVSDQTGCPTWARNLAGVSVKVLGRLAKYKTDSKNDGLYHYCDNTISSWYEFAVSIFNTASGLGLLDEIPRMLPLKSSQYPQIAQRPGFSVLDTAAIRETFGVESMGLNESLAACLQEIEDDK
ncbi:MAG: dTDP-4-dehydrorhamnose reductase [Xanthomonadales bacterium]